MASAVGRECGGSSGERRHSLRFPQTKHQVARGSRPDAEKDGKLYLLKKVPMLHATYQVRLLAFRAQREGKHLVIRVPKGFSAGNSLRELMIELGRTIRIEISDN